MTTLPPVRHCAPLIALLGMFTAAASAELLLGPAQLIEAGGAPIQVPGYSVPTFVDWNSDGLNDLIVGDGGGSGDGHVRIYFNTGTPTAPAFLATPFYATYAAGGQVTTPAEGCQGAFPRVVDWNADGCHDLIVGRADGRVSFFRNVCNNSNPLFGTGALMQVGTAEKHDLDVDRRATPTVTDWNNDGVSDLVCGALDGRIHVYVNHGTNAAPNFHSATYAQEDGFDLYVPSEDWYGRSSPVVMDLDDDGRKDILTGNTEGQLLLYRNVGTDDAPAFSGYELLTAGGVEIDLMGETWARSRPYVCDFNADGERDVLVGAGDGQVYLFPGIPEPASLVLLALAAVALRRRCSA